MGRVRGRGIRVAIVMLATATGCAGHIPKDALLFKPDTLARRQLQTRRFETPDEAKVLSACAGLLQDLGFILDASEPEVGVVVGSKQRSAIEGGQVTAKVLVLLATSVVGAPVNVPIDERQTFRASVVSKRVGEQQSQVAVRVTFQRIVWNDQHAISKLEPLDEPEDYQKFFEMLSKALFLEAHDL